MRWMSKVDCQIAGIAKIWHLKTKEVQLIRSCHAAMKSSGNAQAMWSVGPASRQKGSREADLRAERHASRSRKPFFIHRGTMAVWSSDRRKRKGRPATGRPSLSRENSSNGVQEKPSELSGEILLGMERQCQGIFR